MSDLNLHLLEGAKWVGSCRRHAVMITTKRPTHRDEKQSNKPDKPCTCEQVTFSQGTFLAKYLIFGSRRPVIRNDMGPGPDVVA